MPRMLSAPVADRSKRPPGEALVDLRRRLALLSPRDPARTEVMARAAEAYGVSVWTIYRALRELTRPKSVRRSDHGSTRAVPGAGMERYAEIVAALKIRTSNKKGRHLSTARAIRLLEEDGIETPDGLVRLHRACSSARPHAFEVTVILRYFVMQGNAIIPRNV